MSWTVDTIPDLTNKVFFITGCNSGIGYHAAKLFSQHNATVVMACRNAQKMATAAESFTTGRIIQLVCDTSDMNSVRECVQLFKSTGLDHIDVLLLNAGIMMPPYSLSKQGYESQFATNHLGHFLLTGLLLDYITKTSGSRIISVSSNAHRAGNKFQYDVIKGKNPQAYNNINMYSQTKLANLLFVTQLNRRFIADGIETIAVGAHPGASDTSLGKRDHTPWYISILVKTLSGLMIQSAEAGSWPLVMAAVDPNITRTNYYAPSGWFEFAGTPKSDGFKNNVLNDETLAQQLWTISEEMTDFKYSI